MTRRPGLLDYVFVAALALYTLAGLRLAPFHGDESTIIFMSRDWFRLVRGDFGSMVFREPPLEPSAQIEQELRLVNGVVSKYLIGLFAGLVGLGIDDLNTPWDWLQGWHENLYFNHLPGDKLLIAGRLSSALMLALSVAAVFGIGWRVGGPKLYRASAWLSALVYATMPAVLINGRRAMFEGATLLTTALVILAGLEVIAWGGGRPRKSSRISGAPLAWLTLGVAAGLALASKHNAALTIFPIFAALLWIGRRDALRTAGSTAAALLAGGAVFLALNPAWWSAPLRVPGEVLRLRSTLLADQTSGLGGYSSAAERIGALVTRPFGAAQYYEVEAGWPEWIGGQIAAYQAAGVGGIDWGALSLPVLLLIMLNGAVASLAADRARGLLIIAATAVSCIGVLILNPIPWQRYYLPLNPLFAVLFGLGLGALANLAIRALRNARRAPEARSHA